jgi:hypothetical protein
MDLQSTGVLSCSLPGEVRDQGSLENTVPYIPILEVSSTRQSIKRSENLLSFYLTSVFKKTHLTMEPFV